MFKVISCPLHINKGNTNFHFNVFSFLCRKFRKKAQMFTFQFLFARYYRSLRNTCQIRNTNHFITFPNPMVRNIGTPKTIINQRFTKLRIIINCIIGFSFTITPSTTIRRTFHPTLNCIIIYNFNILRGRGSSYSARQIYLDTGLIVRRISKT